jgi:hypothetical protein
MVMAIILLVNFNMFEFVNLSDCMPLELLFNFLNKNCARNAKTS